MRKHPDFPALVLHEDQELEVLFSRPVKERRQIHHWPLSVVERVEFADGFSIAYKAQLPPTVEAEFYAVAQSPVLPWHRLLGGEGECKCMALEWVEGEHPALDGMDEREIAAWAKSICQSVVEIQGDVPVFRDFSSPDRLHATWEWAKRCLYTLWQGGRFPSITGEDVKRLEDWLFSAELAEHISRPAVLQHGDLLKSQILIKGERLCVLDWQRPIKGPYGIDLATLLRDCGIDPRRHAPLQSLRLERYLHFLWANQAQHDLFPNGTMPWFDQWASSALYEILL